MTTLDTLKLIIGRSPGALHEALGAIKAQSSGSPLAARRAARAAAAALEDAEANWTNAERAELAELLGGGPRDQELRLRVSADEKAAVQAAAQQAGLSLSDYIRRAIGLTETGG